MKKKKVLMTGATGYVADQMLPTFRDRYEMLLTDISTKNRRGEDVESITVTDLIDPDRTGYAELFEGVDAVVHLAYKRRGRDLLDDFLDEKANVEMAYNVLRSAYDAGVPRVVFASSNHAADWYERELIHERKIETLDPYAPALSDNFYGWAKATYEHMGFLFASGSLGRKLEVVMVRIGSPTEVDADRLGSNPRGFKRNLGAYISPRDLTQLFVRSIEAPDIENEHGIPWQVVYGISNNTRAFWSLVSARNVLGYEPEDDSEVKFASDIRRLLTGGDTASGPGRVGIP
jgi:nucleoside-diphosphate-sugar epimerase